MTDGSLYGRRTRHSPAVLYGTDGHTVATTWQLEYSSVATPSNAPPHGSRAMDWTAPGPAPPR
eukprot:1666874-Prymnesium_polylepis.1